MKLTKLSQMGPMGPQTATATMAPPRNNEQIAKAISAAAESFGMTSTYTASGGVGDASGFLVMCTGKMKPDGTADVEITFEIPPFGRATGSVMRGMELGPADKIMRNIMAAATKTGMAAAQCGRLVDPVLCSNPNLGRTTGQTQATGDIR